MPHPSKPDLESLQEEVVQRLLKEEKVLICDTSQFVVWKIVKQNFIVKVFKKFCYSNEYIVMKSLENLRIPNFQRALCEVADIRYGHRSSIVMENVGIMTLRSLIEKGEYNNQIIHSILSQCYYALLIAHETYDFTHYNLTPDTVFLRRTNSKYIVYSHGREEFRVRTFGFTPVITSFIYSYSSVLDKYNFASRIDEVEKGAFTLISDFIGDIFMLFDKTSESISEKLRSDNHFIIEDNIETMDREIAEYSVENGTGRGLEDDTEISLYLDDEGEDDEIDIFSLCPHATFIPPASLSSFDEKSILTLSEDPCIDRRPFLEFRDRIVKLGRVTYGMNHHLLDEYDESRDFIEYATSLFDLDVNKDDLIFDRYFHLTLNMIMHLSCTNNRRELSDIHLIKAFTLFRNDINILTSKITGEGKFEIFSIFISIAQQYIPQYITKPSDTTVIANLSQDIMAIIDKKYKYYSAPLGLDFTRLLRSSIVVSRGLVALFRKFLLRNRQEISNRIANSADPRAKGFHVVLPVLLSSSGSKSVDEVELCYEDVLTLCENEPKNTEFDEEEEEKTGEYRRIKISSVMERRVFRSNARKAKAGHVDLITSIVNYSKASEYSLY